MRMKIVLMRSRTLPDDEYHDVLQQLGQVVSIPALAIQFINQECLFEKVHSANSYSGVIMTSKRACEAIDRVCQSQSAALLNHWTSKSCYVVGKSTAEFAAKLGFNCSGMDSGSSEALANHIVRKRASDTEDLPLLYVCAKQKRDTLPTILQRSGVDFVVLEAYESHPDGSIDANIRSYHENQGAPDVIVYFSPLGYKHSFPVWKQVLGEEHLSSITFVAIGRTTASALEDDNVRVVTASKPSALHVYDAIKDSIELH